MRNLIPCKGVLVIRADDAFVNQGLLEVHKLELDRIFDVWVLPQTFVELRRWRHLGRLGAVEGSLAGFGCGRDGGLDGESGVPLLHVGRTNHPRSS